MKTGFSINHIANIITEDPDIFNEAGNRDDFLNFLRPRSERESEYAPEQAQPQQSQPQQAQPPQPQQPQQPQAPEPPRGISRRTFNQRASALISGKWQKLIPQFDKVLELIGAAEGKPNVDTGNYLEQLAKLYRDWANSPDSEYRDFIPRWLNGLFASLSRVGMTSNIESEKQYRESLPSLSKYLVKDGTLHITGAYVGDDPLFHLRSIPAAPAQVLAGFAADRYLRGLSKSVADPTDSRYDIFSLCPESIANIFPGLADAMASDYIERHGVDHAIDSINSAIIGNASGPSSGQVALCRQASIGGISYAMRTMEEILNSGVPEEHGHRYNRENILRNIDEYIKDGEAFDPLRRFLNYSPSFAKALKIRPGSVDRLFKSSSGIRMLAQAGIIRPETMAHYSNFLALSKKVLAICSSPQAARRYNRTLDRKKGRVKDKKIYGSPMHQPYAYKDMSDSELIERPLVKPDTPHANRKKQQQIRFDKPEKWRKKSYGSASIYDLKGTDIPRDTTERSSETDRRLSSSMHQPFESRLMKALNKVFG